MIIPTPTEAWESTFRKVLNAYRRRWWRWLLQPSWRELAWMDAMHQADANAKWVLKLAEWERWK